MRKKLSPKSEWQRRLLGKIQCPNCWHSFPPTQTAFIAQHPDLLGDDVLGQDEYSRFKPMRFNPRGEALDPKGTPTMEMACPRCRLRIDEALLEIRPIFISLLGSPASGKSYFLTSLTWELRRLLPKFNLSFSDLDPVANSVVQEHEQTLFTNPNPDEFTEIAKTQPDDPRLHRYTKIDGKEIRLPVPFQFLMWPHKNHKNYHRPDKIGRVIVMYDNAGEDCRPDADRSDQSVVKHLAMSKALFMLFDLTQEPRIVSETPSEDPQVTHGSRPGMVQSAVDRQENVLREIAIRLRRFLNVSQNKPIEKPLIVIIPKFDIWADSLGISIDEEPVRVTEEGGVNVDIKRIHKSSDIIREYLLQHTPEIVTQAESFSSKTTFIPVSAMGCSPKQVTRDGSSFYGVRPKDINPKWVTVPLMYCLGYRFSKKK